MDIMTKEKIKIFLNSNDLFEYAATDFARRAKMAIDQKGFFSVVLSGGNTPKLFYEAILNNYRSEIEWEKVQFYFGDERFVPMDNEENNFHMTQKFFFSKIPVDPNHIFPIPTNLDDPEQSANAYDTLLQAAPNFDVIYLGLGEDAHTASLMPETDIVKYYSEHKDERLVVALFVEKLDMFRITLTPRALNQGGDIIFIVCGAKKAKATHAVLEGDYDPLHFPAQLIHSETADTIWYLDKEAGALL